MMGIDDLQLRLDDFLLPQREPGRIRIMRIVGWCGSCAGASGPGVLGKHGTGR
jgi:hypothetical protein